MTLHRRLEKLEHQRVLEDEQRKEKIQIYLERTVPAIATKLGISPDEVTFEIMAKNGDPLAKLIRRVEDRIAVEALA